MARSYLTSVTLHVVTPSCMVTNYACRSAVSSISVFSGSSYFVWRCCGAHAASRVQSAQTRAGLTYVRTCSAEQGPPHFRGPPHMRKKKFLSQNCLLVKETAQNKLEKTMYIRSFSLESRVGFVGALPQSPIFQSVINTGKLFIFETKNALIYLLIYFDSTV